jgi:tetratricopeptide (TPR) repeat protein
MAEWGDEKQTVHFLKRMEQVSDAFENTYTAVSLHRLNGFYQIKFRKLADLLKTSEEAVSLAKKTDHAMLLFMILCFRSMAFTFRSELTEAKSDLFEAEKLLKALRIPLVFTQYLIAKSYIEIAEITDRKIDKTKLVSLLKTTKDLIRSAQKARANLTEAYRLRAVAYRILDKPSIAVKYFKKSIEAGIGYGGNLELSRTYFEIGKFLRDPKNKKDRILGMNSNECLMKAKAMFEEMNLTWDLAEYEKYAGNNASVKL